MVMRPILYQFAKQAIDAVRFAGDTTLLAMEWLKTLPESQDPRSLLPYGGKCFSQNDEDGIIAEIFRRIGVSERRCFVELGVGDGLENNTLALLFSDWKGLWIEGSSRSCRRIRRGYPKTLASGQLKLTQAFITVDNIDRLIGGHFQGEIDLLSIDLDGNDLHILRAITGIRPRVIVMEYNGKFRPPIEYCMEYRPDHRWDGTDNYGASLSSIDRHLSSIGYSLVGSSLCGINCFFVRSDLLKDRFQGPFTAEFHYQPPRHGMTIQSSGHWSSYATLENRQRRAS